jgi:hypothetical protein
LFYSRDLISGRANLSGQIALNRLIAGLLRLAVQATESIGALNTVLYCWYAPSVVDFLLAELPARGGVCSVPSSD